MSRSTIEYLRHILDETRYLQAQVDQLDKTSFLQNETLKRAFVRSLEIGSLGFGGVGAGLVPALRRGNHKGLPLSLVSTP